MKFDIFAIVIMIVAIALGQLLGGYLISMLGDASWAGGLTGSIIIGLCCYAVYTFATGGQFGIMPALLFSIIIYGANLVAGYVNEMMGLGGGVITLVVTGLVASIAWGYIGGQKQGKSKISLPKLK